jgi:hypothetical protein
MGGGGKGKLDTSKQGKAQSFVNGWVQTAKRLRSLAIVILLAVIAFTVGYSLLPAKLGPFSFAQNKFFPHQASKAQIQKARIIRDIKQFHFH